MEHPKKEKKGPYEGMGKRGFTRPEMKHRHHLQEQQKDGEQEKRGGGMDRSMMLTKHHEQTLWVYWSLVILGFWMLVSPLTFDYAKQTVQPSGGRELWISLTDRILALRASDMLSGLLLIVFGWRSLLPNRPVSLWICGFTGIWLNFAPVVFWAPSAFIYFNDTLAGTLVIALAILIPGMPNMISYMKMGSEVPPGWSYNPSSWPQRWIMIVAGFVGWIVSRYLGAYQMGYIDYAWDPFFGSGSMKVLDSQMSKSLPVSDGAVGALAYTFEFLMGWMGSPSRWRTMPWMVTFFGILVIPLGLVHIFLVISQPLVVGEWCTFCLVAAAVMLPMIPLEIDEVVAMGQHMVQAKKNGESMWKVFWKGGKPIEQNMDERSPKLIDLSKQPKKVFFASIWGMSFPWTLVVSTLFGIYLMFAPGWFGVNIENRLANLNHLCGSLIVVVSVICMGEVVRRGRYLNVLLGVCIAAGTWFLGDGPLAIKLINTAVGITVAALAVPRGIKTENYGLWDKYVK